MAQRQQWIEEESSMRMQTYLDALEKPLASLGELERQEWRLEAEAHLHSLIQANQELGSSYDEAVKAALKQFGDTQRIGRNVAYELHKQQHKSLSPEFFPLLFMAAPLVFGMAVIPLVSLLSGSNNSTIFNLSIGFAIGSLFLLLPFISGWFSGKLCSLQSTSDKYARWVWPFAPLMYAIHGFILGSLYANLVDGHSGAQAFFSVPALIAAVVYPIVAQIGMKTQRQYHATRQDSTPLAG